LGIFLIASWSVPGLWSPQQRRLRANFNWEVHRCGFFTPTTLYRYPNCQSSKLSRSSKEIS